MEMEITNKLVEKIEAAASKTDMKINSMLAIGHADCGAIKILYYNFVRDEFISHKIDKKYGRYGGHYSKSFAEALEVYTSR